MSEVHNGSVKRRARPHIREFLADSLTPLGVYRRLAAQSPTRFLFESVTGGDSVSRYSFLGASPWGIYRLQGDRLELERSGARVPIDGDPLENLRAELMAIGSDQGHLPLTGGFVGFLGYDFVRLLERLPGPPPDPFDLPLTLLARFDNLVIFDHAHQKVLAIANEIEGEVSRQEADQQLDALTTLLTHAAEGSAIEVPGESPDLLPAPEPSMSSEEFGAAVDRAKAYIAAGDIFQVVLARRWSMQLDIQPLALYRALRTVNPSPYMVLFETPEVSLVGASPEMLVRKSGSRIETRPIAGTRPRSADPAEDRRLADELLADEKERAEHVMLVDLGRNDLGRVATPASVSLPSFMEIERYSHVMHIVTGVEAEIGAGRVAFDALSACFPAGTVSGAPKIRAMEIIDELEPEARGPYAGAVGYLSYGGDLDTCITIRTLVVRPGEVSVTAGAGIVADSDPEAEARETESKAAATLAAVELAVSLDRMEDA
jgi:anthranilate synthase component 1